jgi:uncharacterized protein (TIGR00369 family)
LKSTVPDFTPVPEGYGPPFHQTLGVRMGIGANREGIAWIEIDPQKHYGARWVHGGMVGALADISSGIAIARTIDNAVNVIDGTIELKVNFLRKVVEGDLTATARVVHAGKRVAVTEVDLTNQGQLCAKAIATFMLRRDLEKNGEEPPRP